MPQALVMALSFAAVLLALPLTATCGEKSANTAQELAMIQGEIQRAKEELTLNAAVQKRPDTTADTLKQLKTRETALKERIAGLQAQAKALRQPQPHPQPQPQPKATAGKNGDY